MRGGKIYSSNNTYHPFTKPDGYMGATYAGSPYNVLRWDVLNIKDQLKNAENLIAVGPDSSADRWVMDNDINADYYRDVIIHGILSGAEFVYTHTGQNYNEWKSSWAYMDLNRIVGFSDRKVIDVPYSWNNDYLLSGMYANGRNVWYITPNTDILGEATFMTETEDGLSFSINGQTVTFAGGAVIEGHERQLGTWVDI